MKKVTLPKKSYESDLTQKWPGIGTGRYVKRQLSKARRRFIKGVIRFGRAKSPSNYEREANWKTW